MSGIGMLLMLLAGVGLFVFALKLIEDAVKSLAGRSFKILLQRLTRNKLLAVLGSAVLAALLQGSSVLMVMVLALLGAGVLSMSGALAFILGANIGTTLDSWVVAVLGFKVNIESFSFPAIILAAVLQMFPSREKFTHYSRLLMGFGLLFLSVSVMKQSVLDQLNTFNFDTWKGVALWKFVLAGLLITVLIQSSLATMTLALSALYSHALDFNAAAAVVIGSEVGTTIKIFFGAMDGMAAKKRLALGNFIINVVSALLAYILLFQLTYLITEVFNMKDPLSGLVAFQSIINIISIIIFLPLINYFARFLERRYRDDFVSLTSFITKEDMVDPGTALDLFSRETDYFVHVAMVFNLDLLGLKSVSNGFSSVWRSLDDKRGIFLKSHSEQYEFLKSLQGELQMIYLSLRSKGLSAQQIERLEQMISSVRSAMHAAKSAKDVSSNIHNLSRSSNDAKFDIYNEVRDNVQRIYIRLEEMSRKDAEVNFDTLKVVFDRILDSYDQLLEKIYQHAMKGWIGSNDFTLTMNCNREIFTSNKAMLFAVKDLLLSTAEANRFNELQVYKT